MLGFLVDVAVSTVTSPIRVAGHVLNIADGLTEGEIRIEAISHLGYEVVMNMTQAELLEWYNDQ